MSEVSTVIREEEIRDALIPLLKEYTQRLPGQVEEVRKFLERRPAPKSSYAEQQGWRTELLELRTFWTDYLNTLSRLSSHASSLLEYRQLDSVTSFDLKLRLLEFERSLQLAGPTLEELNRA